MNFEELPCRWGDKTHLLETVSKPSQTWLNDRLGGREGGQRYFPAPSQASGASIKPLYGLPRGAQQGRCMPPPGGEGRRRALEAALGPVGQEGHWLGELLLPLSWVAQGTRAEEGAPAPRTGQGPTQRNGRV